VRTRTKSVVSVSEEEGSRRVVQGGGCVSGALITIKIPESADSGINGVRARVRGPFRKVDTFRLVD
jgi:hypothetical protein